MPKTHVGLPTLGRYYKSAYWNRVRGLLMYLRNGKCERCGATQGLQAHHRTYAHLFSELSHMDDMELLCKTCHDEETKRSRAKRSFTRRLVTALVRQKTR